MDLKRYKVDVNAELDGTWVPFGDDAELLIARWLNPKCREAMAKHSREMLGLDVSGVPDAALEGKLTDQDSVSMIAKIIADSILLDWRGNMLYNGKPLEYSKERCYGLMADPSLHDFRDFVINKAMARETFLQKGEADLKGN